jgi:hypothetical protein
MTHSYPNRKLIKQTRHELMQAARRPSAAGDGQLAQSGQACRSTATRWPSGARPLELDAPSMSALRAAAPGARQRESDPACKADYAAARPKVERKISH